MGINKVLGLNSYNRQIISWTLKLFMDKAHGQIKVQIYIFIVASISNMPGKQSEDLCSAQKYAYVHDISVDQI